MNIRKFNSREDFKVVEDDQCCWCEAGLTLVDWGTEGGTIFLENDQGEIRTVEGIPMGRAVIMKCSPITADKARAIIAEHASS